MPLDLQLHLFVVVFSQHWTLCRQTQAAAECLLPDLVNKREGGEEGTGLVWTGLEWRGNVAAELQARSSRGDGESQGGGQRPSANSLQSKPDDAARQEDERSITAVSAPLTANLGKISQSICSFGYRDFYICLCRVRILSSSLPFLVN